MNRPKGKVCEKSFCKMPCCRVGHLGEVKFHETPSFNPQNSQKFYTIIMVIHVGKIPTTVKSLQTLQCMLLT